MYVHSCCCLYFVEWSSFNSNWFYQFFSKGLSKSWKNKKGKRFPLPLSISGSAHFSPPPRPAFPPSPSLFLAPAQRQRGPLRGPDGAVSAARPSPSPLQMTGRARASASLPGRARQSDPSPTSSPARTRVRAQPPRVFHVSSPFPVGLWPFKYSPRRPQSPNSSRAAAAASNFAKVAAKIRAATNPPLQRLRVSVISWPGFRIALRSRRNSLFPILRSVLVANARRTSFQGRRPPIAVASP